MAAQVKVREHGLGLLRPRLSAAPVTTAPLKAAYAQMRRYVSEPYLYVYCKFRNVTEVLAPNA